MKRILPVLLVLLCLFAVSCDQEAEPRERAHKGQLRVKFAAPAIEGTPIDKSPITDDDFEFYYCVQLYAQDEAQTPGASFGGDSMTICNSFVPSGTWTVKFILCDNEYHSIAYYTWDCSVTIEDQKATYVEMPADQNGLYLFQNLDYYLAGDTIMVRSYSRTTFNESQIPMSGGKYMGWGTFDKIAAHGFDGCTSLTNFSLDNCSVKSIGEGAFANCTSLESFTIPEGIERIEASTFENCTSLRTVTIPSSVKYIGPNAFKNCSSLESIVIPEGVVYVSDHCFDGCTHLHSVDLPSTVKLIKPYAFYNCAELQTIELPDGLLEIEEYGFAGCALTSIQLPDSVGYLRAHCFEQCQNLVKVGFSTNSSMRIMNDYVFYNDFSLTTLGPVDGEVLYQSVFYKVGNCTFAYCSSITKVVIPTNNIDTIGYMAFYGCTSLSDINITENIVNINASAFFMCSSLQSVYIPASVSDIGNGAFDLCTSLARIDCGASSIPDGWADMWLGQVADGCQINWGVAR